ncbi:MAG: hypothetical protein Q4G25_01165 [Paracoccus sp. (in: a-proteobacteria)]|nr:hypothetical protein [Paracoccus sp. (in: a-proteobacteria)]
MGQVLIWAGAVLTTAGLAAIIWCILTVRAARMQGEEALRARMQTVIPVNFAALAASTLGLMAVIIGIVLR